MVGVAVVNSLLFGVYGALLEMQGVPAAGHGHPTLWQIFVAGSGSGLINSFASAPMELVKIRLQNQGIDTSPTPRRRRPPQAPTTTTTPTSTPTPTPTTTTATTRMAGRRSFTTTNATPTAATTATATTVPPPNKYAGPFDCTRQLYRENGLRGLYRGFFATMIRETPSYGAYFVSYEILCRMLAPVGTDPKDISGWRLMLAGRW